jgi:hypothetical protein
MQYICTFIRPNNLMIIKTYILRKVSLSASESIQQDYINNTSTNSKMSPYSRFIYALNAPESKRQYPTRFQVFLDFLKLDG